MKVTRRSFASLRMTTLVALGAVLALATTAHAQGDAITRDVIARAVTSIANRVEANYVIPDTGRMIAEYVRKRLASGAYDQLQTRAQFTDRISADLKAVNGDPHLYVQSVARPTAPATPSGSGPRMVMRGAGPSAEDVEQARRGNYDVRRAERLTGNVGYIDLALVSSSGIDEAFKTIDAAMAFLEWTDAMIIDVRRTPGGEPRMSDYIASYFFGPDSVRTLTTSLRSQNMTMERWTGRVAGKKRPTIPVYVLTGPGTGSGAEDLAFIFKSTGRGTLVGERSAGAGRPNSFYPVDESFRVSVSGGRTFDPRTGKEWERVGIEPDVASSVDEALLAAQTETLKKLASAEQNGARRRELEYARANIEARWHRRVVSADVLTQLVGEYDTRRVTQDGGKLYYGREGSRSREELVPISDTLFALGDATHVAFVRDGSRVTSMQLLTPDGQIATRPRTGMGAQSLTQPTLRTEVDSLHAAMVAAFKRDPASVARFYSDDARIIGMGSHLSGRAAVDGYWGQGMPASNWTLEVVDVGGAADSPWVLGRSTLVGAGGQRMVTDYLAILVRGTDGRLRYRIDLFTPAEPMMRRPG